MTEHPDPVVSDALERETLRLNARYLTEVVEAFGLCPWARSARLSGSVDRVVIQGSQDAIEAAVSHLGAWAERPEVEIGLLIFPQHESGPGDFQRLVNQVIAADAKRFVRASPPFALAAFHPEATLDTSSADRLVPFLRRTPDPTIQAVRISALERVRGEESAGTRFVDPRTLDLASLPRPEPTLREKIGRHNLATVQQAADAIVAAIEAIRADRAQTRARLGLGPGEDVP